MIKNKKKKGVNIYENCSNKVKYTNSSDLLERLNEIDDKLQDFDISAYKYDLLCKEQSKLKIELQERGYSVN